MEKKTETKEQMWESIQDIIGPANKWPKWIRELFFTKNLNHAQRPLICAFVVFNGLNPEVICDKLFSFYTILFES